MGMEEKSMKKWSSEKALDGMQQNATKCGQRGEKYGIAVSCGTICVPLLHYIMGCTEKHRKQLNNHIIISMRM